MKRFVRNTVLTAAAVLSFCLMGCDNGGGKKKEATDDYAATSSFEVEFSEDFFKVFDITVNYYDTKSDDLQTKVLSAEDNKINIPETKTTEKTMFGGYALITKKAAVEAADQYVFKCTFETTLVPRKGSYSNDAGYYLNGTVKAADLDEWIKDQLDDPICALYEILDYDGNVEVYDDFEATYSFNAEFSADFFKLFDITVHYYDASEDDADIDTLKTVTLTAENNSVKVPETETTEKQLFGGYVEFTRKAEIEAAETYNFNVDFTINITTREKEITRGDLVPYDGTHATAETLEEWISDFLELVSESAAVYKMTSYAGSIEEVSIN